MSEYHYNIDNGDTGNVVQSKQCLLKLTGFLRMLPDLWKIEVRLELVLASSGVWRSGLGGSSLSGSNLGGSSVNTSRLGSSIVGGSGKTVGSELSKLLTALSGGESIGIPPIS